MAKARKAGSSKRRRSTSARKGATGKLSMQGTMDTAMKAGMFVGGMFIGSKAAGFIENKLNNGSAVQGMVEGLLGVDIKGALPAIATTGVGIVGTQLLKDEKLKYLSMGVAGAGVAKTVKHFTGKDLLNGLSGDDEVIMIPGAAQQAALLIPEPKITSRGDDDYNYQGVEGSENIDLDLI